VEEPAAKAVDDIGVGLAERVRRACVIVGCADIGQRRRRGDPRRRQRDRLEREGRLDLPECDVAERGSKVRGESRRRLAYLGESGLLVLKTPAPVLARTDVHRANSTVTSL
jgi:hypothetical protein